MKHKNKALKITLISILSFILLIFIIFGVYVAIYNHASDDNDQYLNSDEHISVTLKDNMYTFKNNETKSNTGYIFYPGAKVEYNAYAPVLYKLTKETGVTCYLPHMTFNLAFFSSNIANTIIEDNPSIDSWYLGGHSLGGAMACNYLKDNGNKYKGVILEGSYSVCDLTQYTNLSSLLIKASEDKVLNNDKYEDGKKYLLQIKFQI